MSYSNNIDWFDDEQFFRFTRDLEYLKEYSEVNNIKWRSEDNKIILSFLQNGCDEDTKRSIGNLTELHKFRENPRAFVEI